MGENRCVVREVDIVCCTNHNVLIEIVVCAKIMQERQHFVFSHMEILISYRVSSVWFPNKENVKFFRETGQGCAKRSKILWKRDDISATLVLSVFADPHHETQ